MHNPINRPLHARLRRTLSAALAAAAVALAPLSSACAEDFGTHIVSQFGGGASRTGAILSDGVTAVVNMGPRLVAFDLTTMGNPVELGDLLLPRVPVDIKVFGVHAYVAFDQQGFIVVNLANPAAPTVVGDFAADGPARELHVGGGRLLVAGGSTGLRIYDLATPGAPLLRSSIDPAESVDEVTGFGSFAAYSRNSSIQLADVFAMDNPVPLGQINVYGPKSLAMKGMMVYVIDGDGDLRTYSFQNALAPVQVNVDNPGGFAFIVRAQGNTLAVGSSGAGVTLFSIADAANPTPLSSLPLPSPAPGEIVMNGSRSFFPHGDGVQLGDLSNPANPLYGSYILNEGPVTRVARSGHIAYLGTPERGLIVMNYADPANPVEIANYDLPDFAEVADLLVEGNTLYMLEKGTFVGQQSKLIIFNVSNPAAPLPWSTTVVQPGAQLLRLAKLGNHLGVTSYDRLTLVNVSNAGAPAIKGHFVLPPFCRDLTLAAGHFVVACGSNGTIIINPANVNAPTLAGIIPLTGPNAAAMSASGDGSHVAVGDGVVTRLYNISTPGFPITVSTLPDGLFADDLQLAGETLHVASALTGYSAFDLSDEDNPLQTAAFTTADTCMHVAASLKDVLVADEDGGVFLLASCTLGDLNCDGAVDGADLGLLLAAWGTTDAAADLNDDGLVDGADLGLLLAAWSL